ncbi:hypothetical protein SAY86_011031 [Trapa natans]|uniref:Uncharacterized protein n=1 Tax=Trapa natans TaxID=22666 RepID=A0AAN7LFR0_TRANT|nr:hypothetical protein SAY86_011031 [Trapa natans]
MQSTRPCGLEDSGNPKGRGGQSAEDRNDLYGESALDEADHEEHRPDAGGGPALQVGCGGYRERSGDLW